jgi:putative phage-type endonuclease
MIVLDIEQGTEEWQKARLGIPTASNFDKIVTTKGDLSKQSKKYLYTLASEQVTGVKEEGYTNGVMQRGNELEQEARDFYELTQSATIEKVGFVYSDESKSVGASPDGFVGEEGGIEIKCPLAHTHVGYLLGKKLPTEYIQQVQGNLFVTGRDRDWETNPTFSIVAD